MISVSVVVTAYNVERYIRDTLKSVAGQTWADIEIIVVNDGSTDGTRQAVEAIQVDDPRITLLNTKNGGVSAARNCGLDLAVGEYVLFTDGDDILLPSACEILYRAAREGDADIVVSDYFVRSAEDNREVRVSGGSFAVVAGREFAGMLMAPQFTVAVWNKLFRRSLYGDGAIRFPAGINMGEDLVTLFRLCFDARRIVKVDEPTIIYVKRRGSLVATLAPGHYSATAAMEQIRSLIDQFPGGAAGLIEKFPTTCYYHVMCGRVIPGRAFGGVHRKLYDWYRQADFGGMDPVSPQFHRSLAPLDRIVARAYGHSYAAGTSVRRFIDMARVVFRGHRHG